MTTPTAEQRSDQEEWRQVVGFPGYEVSSFGNVKTFWKRMGNLKPIIGQIGRVMAFGFSGTKKPRTLYRKVSLRRDGRKHDRKVHHLVLEAFVGLRPDAAMQARHMNGNSLDNRIGNLRWGTRKENSGDKVRHGTRATGERHGASILKEKDIKEIRRMSESGAQYTTIAKSFGVHETTISLIAKRKTWKGV